MAEVTLDAVKKLRAQTGAGIGLCKEALEIAQGDVEKAYDHIRKSGALKSQKRVDRQAVEGVIGVYHHGVDQRVAAMIELNCETDFVAKNDEFRALAHDLAMQVAAMKPEYVDRSSVPSNVIEKEKEIHSASQELVGKPDSVIETILEGKIEKFYKQNCLMEQEFFKDDSKTIQDLIDEAVAKIGEKIVVTRIYRMAVGE